jgi:hypothetical protein
VVDVLDKLVAFPSLLSHPNLTLEVLLLREDHVRAARPDTTGHRRRDPGERRLVEVLDRVEISSPEGVLRALPELPRQPFSTGELSALLGCSTRLAQRAAYCLRLIEMIEPAGKRGQAPLHRRTRG